MLQNEYTYEYYDDCDDVEVYVLDGLVKQNIKMSNTNALLDYLMNALSKGWKGSISLTTEFGKVTQYHYITEETYEVEYFYDIQQEIDSALDIFNNKH